MSTKFKTTEVSTGRPVDLRRATRVFAAVLIPVGPACVAALRYLLPYQTSDNAADAVAAIAAAPDRQYVVVWLGFLAMLTLVPGVLFVGRVARQRAPRLTAVALLLLVPGYLALGFLVAADAVAWYGVTRGFSPAIVADLFEHGHPSQLMSAGVFVLGHVLGTVLLGVALLRGRAVPAVAAWLVIVAQPLHFVAAVILGSPLLDLAAWGSNAVGFAAVSLVVLRMRDEEWEPAPVRTPGSVHPEPR
jgi:hypothetical protein